MTWCGVADEDQHGAGTDAEPSRTCPSRDFVLAKGILPSRSLSVQACFECRVAGGLRHVEEACHDQVRAVSSARFVSEPMPPDSATPRRGPCWSKRPHLAVRRHPSRRVAGLTAHLESQYGIGVTSVAPIDDDPATRPHGSWPGHYPWTLIVKRDDGSAWIARVFSSPADGVGRVEGDAEILRFLAAQEFPAERIAQDDPVSVLEAPASS